MTKKEPRNITSFRLSQTALKLLAALSVRNGIPRTACLELAIREMARAQGVK